MIRHDTEKLGLAKKIMAIKLRLAIEDDAWNWAENVLPELITADVEALSGRGGGA